MKRLQSLITLCALACAIALVPSMSFAQSAADAVTEKKVEIKELTDSKSFDAEMKNAKTIVVVDFTAAWCGPCQMLKPKLDQLAQEFKGKVVFTKVEQTVSPGLVNQYGVRAFPTVKIFAPGGKELSTSVGNVSLKDLRDWIQGQLDAYNKSVQPQNTPSNPKP